MTSFKHILYASITAACLLPPGLYAQELEEEGAKLAPLYASEVEVGIGYNSADSFKFGKFNGLTDEGAYFIGNFDVRKARAAGDSSTDYWELKGSNLGLDSRSVYGQYARAGSFKVYIDYDQRVNNLVDDGMTPYRGAGTSRLTLPSNWVTGAGVRNLTSLFTDLQGVTIQKERQKVGGGFTYELDDIWSLNANYHHEDKDGTDSIGAIFGSSGGNPRGAVVPIPHDFTFDEFNGGIVYKGEVAQFTLSYNMSFFDNNTTSFVFDNPYNYTSWPAAARSTGSGILTPSTLKLVQGQMSDIFPDNDAWSINFAGGYNFDNATRLTANVTYGHMNQNEAFLPYSINANLYDVPAEANLPRASLDGEVENTFINVNLTHRFNSDLDAKGRLTYENRDNNTPREVYNRIAGDAQLQSTGSAYMNRPYSLERIKFEAEGGYRLPYMTKLTLGYTYEEKNRNYQEVDNTIEHAIQVRLNSMPADWISGWARYRYSTLDGGDNPVYSLYQQVLDAAIAAGIQLDPSVTGYRNYMSNKPQLEGEDPADIQAELQALIAAPTVTGLRALFDNDPLIRKYYLANRDQHQFNMNVTVYPTPEWTMSALGKFTSNDYPDSPTGVQYSTLENLTFDLTYSPSDRFSANAFFTVERNEYNQRGWYHSGTQNDFPPESVRVATYGNNAWRILTNDRIYTTGMSFAWEVIEKKFNVDLDMTFSDAFTDVKPKAEDYAASTGLGAVAPILFPSVESRIYRLKLTGDYKWKDNWGSRVYYWYERYDSTDFELDGVGVGALNLSAASPGSVILLGDTSPTYHNHVIGFTVYRKF